MSELGDSWQQLRDESQKFRQKKQEDNTGIVMHLAGEYGFEVKVIQEYHLRLSHPSGKPLDYFPQRGKATWLGSNRWFKIRDIEAFIMDNWKKEPDYCEHCSGTGEGRADGLSCNYCVNGVKRKMKDREPN